MLHSQLDHASQLVGVRIKSLHSMSRVIPLLNALSYMYAYSFIHGINKHCTKQKVSDKFDREKK